MELEPAAHDGFAEFVTGSYAAPVRTAYLLTGDRGHAEDLVQQCLLSTYRSWRLLDRRVGEPS